MTHAKKKKQIANRGNLTHIDEHGRAKMVDVTDKKSTTRKAIARGYIKMKPQTLKRIIDGGIEKGDVLAVAQVAGIMAAKKTHELIPMCHPLQITSVDIDFDTDKKDRIGITATVKTTDRTGVEMEALTAVASTALTIYDMCKSADKDMIVSDILLVKKSGGKSGDYTRKED